MSWSLSYVGRAVDVNRAVHEHASTDHLTGSSLEEFDAAKPHIVALLEMNTSEEATSGKGPDSFLIHVRASGSAYKKDGNVVSSQLQIKIERPEGRNV